MCIVAVAHLTSNRYPLIVAANRDERHNRASTAADWWDGPGSLLAGRDLEAGGSWLGISAAGRFAAVTNILDQRAGVAAARSRGDLVTGFLTGSANTSDYAACIASSGAKYGPFNLVVVADRTAEFVSNRNAAATLDAGIHCFSNNRPGLAWAKVDVLADAIEAAMKIDDLQAYLLDALSGPAARGPIESAADNLFIVGDKFGTRCATVLTVDRAGRADFVEQRFGPDGAALGRADYRFELATVSAGH